MAGEGTKFEDDLKDLEDIVARLDAGELGLEDSIAAFERGVALVRALNHRLDEIERRVEVLTRTAQGDLKSEPLKEADDDDSGSAGERGGGSRDKGT